MGPSTIGNDLHVSVLSLDRETPSRENLLRLLTMAVQQGSRLVVIPFGFPGRQSAGYRSFFSRLSRRHSVHLVAGYREKRRHIVQVYSPDGKIAGEYSQTHRLPGESLLPGKILAPIPTELGRMGLSAGSDLYFPEIHWSLAQQGADFLIHLDTDRGVYDHFHSVLSPKVRAFDCHRPFLLARPSSRSLKLVHNEEMEISGTPMSGSVVIDQNGAILASTGFSQGVATAALRTGQHCRSEEQHANLPLSRGLDVWKLYFNDSRAKYFSPLRQAVPSPRKLRFRKRRIRVAVLSHLYAHQIGKDDAVLLSLLREACAARPDIVVCTEMEAACRPETPPVARRIGQMVNVCRKAGAYLLVGGIRPAKPGTPQDRISHARLWDRTGKLVLEPAIMLYGRGFPPECYDADFGRIGLRLCGDVYAPELDRLFALQGADIVFNPSMSWGASGAINTEIAQVRAMDNGHYIVNAHLAFSDAAQRSQVIDPNGVVVAASAYFDNSILLADINLDSKRGVFLPAGRRKIDPNAYLASYRSEVAWKLVPQSALMKFRRPELYHLLNADLPQHPYTTRDRGDGCRVPR